MIADRLGESAARGVATFSCSRARPTQAWRYGRRAVPRSRSDGGRRPARAAQDPSLHRDLGLELGLLSLCGRHLPGRSVAPNVIESFLDELGAVRRVRSGSPLRRRRRRGTDRRGAHDPQRPSAVGLAWSRAVPSVVIPSFAGAPRTQVCCRPMRRSLEPRRSRRTQHNVVARPV